MTARVARREFSAFLDAGYRYFADEWDAEGWAASDMLRYGTRDAVRGALYTPYSGLLSAIPQPSRQVRQDYGISPVDNIVVSVADMSIQPIVSNMIGYPAIVTHETVTTYTDGTTATLTQASAYTVASYSVRAGVVSLNLVDRQNSLFDAVYPSNTWLASDWPGILQADAGKPVPFATGTAIKIPCVLLSTNSDVGPWVYGVCEAPATVLTVYRDGRIVASSEYTVGISAGRVTLTFSSEQVDYSGNPYPITADCQGALGNDAVTEIKRILKVAGAVVDESSFATAIGYAATTRMLVDIAYTNPRSFSAIIADLLLICRASLVRGPSGDYIIIQDTPGSSSATYDENAGDAISVTEYNSANAPKTTALKYSPNIVTPSSLEFTIERDTGGYAGTKNYQAPYLSDDETADRLSCYLTQRLKYGATAKALVYFDGFALGQQITVSSLAYWSGAKTFVIIGMRLVPGGTELTLLEYNAAVHSYTAQAFPAGATQGYSPDYSKTPPAAPTSLSVVSTAASLTVDGTAIAYASVRCAAPAVNFSKVYFQASNDVTGEIYQGIGSVSGGYYVVTLSGLRPNAAHHLTAWGENAYGVQGVTAAAVAFTSGAYGTAPAAPGTPTATQGTGKVINVAAPASAGVAVKMYQWQRSVNGGAYAGIDGSSNALADTSVSYSNTYAYKCQAVDFVGNVSGYSAASNTVTLAVNVGTADVVDTAITTVKRSDASIASFVCPSVPGGGTITVTITHGLGRIPLWDASVTNSTSLCMTIGTVTATTVDVSLYNHTASAVVAPTVTFGYW